MHFAIRQMLLGLLLIALVSSVLLFSDMDRRKKGLRGAPRVALLQYASQPAIDESVKGMIDGLAEAGFIDGKSIGIPHYKAEGEVATLNLIAHEVAGGTFDLIVTSTTLALQAVANANKERRLPHVFGLVADPAAAGVGISRDDPLDHPKHLVDSMLTPSRCLSRKGRESLVCYDRPLIHQSFPFSVRLVLPGNELEPHHLCHASLR